MWILCLSEEYDHVIGKDLSNLQNWQRVCREVGLTGVKDMFISIKKCKMVSFLLFFFRRREMVLTVFRLCPRCM